MGNNFRENFVEKLRTRSFHEVTTDLIPFSYVLSSFHRAAKRDNYIRIGHYYAVVANRDSPFDNFLFVSLLAYVYGYTCYLENKFPS